MPRVYLQHTGEVEPNYPADFCIDCWPADPQVCADISGVSIEEAEECIEQCGKEGHDHPPYEDEDYCCEDCGEELTEKDNGW